MTDATPNPLYNLECAPNTGNHEDRDLLAGDNLDKLRDRNPYPAMSERYRLTEEPENAKYQNNLLIKRCRELEKQRDEATAWRPIETAPRGSGLDGPHRRDEVGYVDPPALLLAYRDGVAVGSYDWYYHPGYGNGGSLGQSPWRDHYEGREIPEVTHWMPLPKPPREKEGGGA